MYNFYVRIADDGRRMKADDRPLMFRSSVLLHVAFLLAQYQPTQLAGSMRAGTALHELVVHVAAPSTFDFYGNEHAAAPDGSEARPFRSLHAARDALRAGLGAGRPRTVLVHGDHFLETPLQLDSRDSGSLDAPITYRSGSALKPARISGGRKLPISSFKPAIVPSGATGVVKTNLFALGLNASDVVGMEPALQPGNYPVNSLELFVDGEPMLRARSPNVAPDGTWLWAGYENVTSVSNMSVTLADTTLGALWAKAAAVGELYLHGYFQWDYRDDYLKVDSIVPVAGGTSFNITRDYYTVPQYPFTKGCRFYALNSLELLDQPGEYYLDPRSGDLYVLPERPFTDDSDVVVSVLRNVIDAKAVSYHVWKDLVISDARGSPLVIEGGGRNNIIVGNTVSNSGLFCIAVAGSNNIVRNNTVFGCGQGGISLFAGLPLSALDRGNSSIYGNHISNFSRICRTYTPGVTTSGVGNYIGYNTMKNSPHTMITAGAVDTVFEYNHLEHACFETSDASAFYVGRSWNQRGNIFRFNTIINVRATEKLGLVAAAAPCCQQVGICEPDCSLVAELVLFN
jgi:parallel beta-helix repeat protein